MTPCSPRLVVLSLCLLSASACHPHVATPTMDPATCSQEIRQVFGPQDWAIVALRAKDKQSLFRPEILEALDRVCAGFEDAAVDDELSVKCMTNLPIMEGRPTGTRVVIGRDDLPMSPARAVHFGVLVGQFEFARGDIIDKATGSSTTYFHLPLSSFDGVDLVAKAAQLATQEEALLDLAMDQDGNAGGPFRRIAGNGPSFHYLVGLYDSGNDGGIKEPATLLAMERFQEVAESLPKVAQTFSIADDLKTVRRGLHRGDPAQAVIPLARGEVSQLLLALSLNQAGNFGPRMDSAERVAVLRVNLASASAEQRRKTTRHLTSHLAAQVLPGHRAFLCGAADLNQD